MAKKNHHPVSAEVENNPLYHDTYKLLRCYRDSTYSLMVAVRQVEIQFQLEYNTSVDEFLDSIYAAGADQSGLIHAHNALETAILKMNLLMGHSM